MMVARSLLLAAAPGGQRRPVMIAREGTPFALPN
jgi:hypothetical protein